MLYVFIPFVQQFGNTSLPCQFVPRYRQTGDPRGFKSFCSEQEIPPCTFVRYVGNRLHVLFLMAGRIFKYQSELKEYLSK